MPGVTSIAMKSIRTTNTHFIKTGVFPFCSLFIKFLLFILEKKPLNQNDVEFDFSMGHALVLFLCLWIIKKII